MSFKVWSIHKRIFNFIFQCNVLWNLNIIITDGDRYLDSRYRIDRQQQWQCCCCSSRVWNIVAVRVGEAEEICSPQRYFELPIFRPNYSAIYYCDQIWSWVVWCEIASPAPRQLLQLQLCFTWCPPDKLQWAAYTRDCIKWHKNISTILCFEFR